jgi:hypothetical protein
MTTMADVPEGWFESFVASRQVPNHGFCSVQCFSAAWGLLVNVRFNGPFYEYDARYYYGSAADALAALLEWDGQGSPPGNWVKDGAWDA